MSSEPAILARIREALESVVAPADAARIMIDALGRWGPRVPVDLGEVTAFVDGPLAASLAARASEAETLHALAMIDEVLANAAAPTRPHAVADVEVDVEPEWLEERTADLPRAQNVPVPVLVVSDGTTLASRLRSALGIERIAAVSRGDREGVITALAGDPLIVLVDATDVPSVAPDDLVPLLAGSRALRAVWGAELPYGRRFDELCRRDQKPLVTVRIADGMASIVDLVASRRA